MPEYFTRPEVPGQRYFDCSALRGSLSVTSCAGMWRKANAGRPDPMSKCAGCEIGAEHAGERIIPMSPIQTHRACCRCRRTSGRLIRSIKCVSCFNRELEVVKGRNAKGLPPVKHAPLGNVRLRYRINRPGARTLERVTDAAEAMLAMVHKHGAGIQFGFHSSFRSTWVQGGLF